MELKYLGKITLDYKLFIAMEFCEYCISTCEDVYNYVKNKERAEIVISKKQIPDIKTLNKEQVHDKLFELGLLGNFYDKKLFIRLLLDFCLYMRQAVNNLREFKPQIAFTLVRKPLFDTLYFLERMLIDKEKTIYELLNNVMKGISCKQIEEINKSIQKKYKNKFYNVFEIRCGKNHLNLKKICDKASHIITNSDFIKSNIGELNFVFMEEQDVNKNTELFLKIVPLVFYYAVDIIFCLMEEIFNFDSSLLKLNKKILDLNLMNFSLSIWDKIDKDKELNKLKIECKNCKKKTTFIALVDKNGRYLQCVECKNKLYYTGFITK